MILSRKFQVVKIIDSSKIVINGGSENQLTVGDMFQISGPKGEEVVDPETNRPLGHLTTKKAIVEITTVMEKMAICESTSKDFLRTSAILRSYRPPLNVDPDDITGGEPEDSDQQIKIGDTALQIPHSRM